MSAESRFTSRRRFLKATSALPVGLVIDPSLICHAADGNAATEEASERAQSLLDRLNVVWDSPSESSFGSMPLGNGDVGANVWVEPNGDLLFYIGKVDALDAGHLLPILGRARLRFAPPLDVRNFRQTLVLEDGAVRVEAGGVELSVWVDANNPVIRVTGMSKTPVEVVTSFETLRPCSQQEDRRDCLAWGYRNNTSAWIKNVQVQNTAEFAARVHDPILNRTSGCRMSGTGFVRDGKTSLKLAAAEKIDLWVRVLSSQTATPEEWFAELEQQVLSDWSAHQAWWRAFWERSHISVTGCGEEPVHLDAVLLYAISARFAGL
jgi:alpha-L-fucosidase 2